MSLGDLTDLGPLVAAAFTAVTRNQTAALVLLFLWPLAVENVVGMAVSLALFHRRDA